LRVTPEHYAVYRRAFVLQREIQMAGGMFLEIRNLRFNEKSRQESVLVHHHLDVTVYLVD
jgi:hypothetical protein